MPSFEVTGPDGKRYEVKAPEGATQDEVLDRVRRHAQEQPQPGMMDRMKSGMRAMNQATRGVAEVGAHMAGSALVEPAAGLAGIGGALRPHMPANAIAGRTQGQGPEAVAAVRSAADFLQPRSESGQQLAQNIGEAVAPAFEFVDRKSEEMAGGNPLIATALQTAALGAPEVLGLKGAGAASRAARSLPTKPKAAPKPAPSIDELFAEGRRLFNQVDDAGVTVKADPVRNFVNDLADKASKEGLDPDITPAAHSALKRIVSDAEAGELTFSQLETLRKVANNAAGTINKADSRMASIIIDDIDSFIDNLDATKVASGDAQLAKQSIKEARDYWHRARKADEIQTLFEKAENAKGPRGQGFDEKLRIQFRQLADNPKRFKKFNKAEQAAILKVVRGGSVDAVLGLMASFAPRGIVSMGLGGSLGFAVGGPPGAAAVMLAGEGARRVGAARRVNAAEQVSEMVRQGSTAPPQ